MSDPAIHADRLLSLAGAVCNEIASEKDFVELDVMLRTNKALRHQYVDYCRIHAALRLELRAHRAAQKACRQVNTEVVVTLRMISVW